MSQSINDSQLSVGQESGIIDARKPHFGPATREHYDTATWTMTLPGAYAREILENPDAPERKRGLHCPAFLKPSLAETRLPALVKILHAIPLARAALLNVNHTLPDYGVDAEWWDGVPINVRVLKAVNPEQEEHQTSSGELIYEMQRLMAFLDGTERAYGSADVLNQLAKATREWKADQSLGAVLEGWAAATLDANPENPLINTFSSEARRIDPDQTEPEIHPFSCLELSIPESSESGPLQMRTLYDVLDFALWGSLQEGSSEYAFLHKLGDVICVQITCQNKNHSAGLGIKVPAIWYLDRYLETSKRKVLDMLAAERSSRKEIFQVDHAKARIMGYKSSTRDEAYDASLLIAKARKHFANNHPSVDTTNGSLPESRNNRKDKVLDELQQLAKNVEQKLESGSYLGIAFYTADHVCNSPRNISQGSSGKVRRYI